MLCRVIKLVDSQASMHWVFTIVIIKRQLF